MSEVRGRKSEGRDQMAEVRCQKAGKMEEFLNDD